MGLFFLSFAGLVLLVVAGDLLVRGAVALSLKLGVPALVISLTVVAFGTSAPELLIAVQSALEGAPGIAFGNVIGSNIANILLVLGVPAVISGIAMHSAAPKKSYLQMIGASGVFILVCFLGPLGVWHGCLLLALLLFMLVSAARSSGTEDDLEDIDPEDAKMRGWIIAALLLGGVIGLPLGAHFLIEGATGLAREFGVSDAIIGLTLVAIGTSLPELATTVSAAFRRQADVALGNVIGSNMFNILGIMGVASFFGPLPVDPELLEWDLWVMLAASLLLGPFILRHISISRAMGVGFLGVYIVYLTALF